MRTTFTLILLVISFTSFCQDDKVQVGINLSSYLSNQTDLGIGTDITIGFRQKHQLSFGTKIPFHRIGRTKTTSYTENAGILNASYQYFFWQKPQGVRTYAIANMEYSFWNYQRDFFYTEGEVVYESLNGYTSYDYSFNAQTGLGTRGFNLYLGAGVELPISDKLYFSGFAAIGVGHGALIRNFRDVDNSIALINNRLIRSRSFAFQAAVSVGYRFN